MKAIRNSNLNAALTMAKEMAPIEYTRQPRSRWTITNPVPSFNVGDHIPCRAVLCCPMPNGEMRREYIPMHGKSVIQRNARRSLPIALQIRARNELQYEMEMVHYEIRCGEYTRAELLGIMGARKAKRPTLHLR